MIRKNSIKRAGQIAEYSKLRKEFLIGKICGVCKNVRANEIHHMAGKNGKLLIDLDNFLPVCRPCHLWITEFSKEAIEQGFSKRRNT